MEAPGTNCVTDLGRKYLRLSFADGAGPIRTRRLIEYFGSIDAVLTASRAQLQRVQGVGEKVADAVLSVRGDARVEREERRAAELGVRILCVEDPDYPKPLLQMPDPPTCLYVRGTLDPTDAVAVAIVGSRRCSHYGQEQALRFGELLGQAGFTVVSGFARGIDGCAHRGAIQSGGRTIAVLGNGLGNVYPPEHAPLADEVAAQGALMSELPLDVAPDSKNFPARNRIIAGLSLGVLVVEAGANSGALITAKLALEYNREVFAIPGRIDYPATSAGVNRLIRDGGAKLVTCLEDILAELEGVGTIMQRGLEQRALQQAAAPRRTGEVVFGPEEHQVLEAIGQGEPDSDTICARTRLEAGRVAAVLMSLQLKGQVKQLPGRRFTRTTALPD